MTIPVSAISFLVFLTIYFFLSWQPKVLVDLGFGISTAASIAGASSFAGACGCVIFGLLSRWFDGRVLAMISIVGLGIGVIAFGAASPAFAVVAAVFAGTCVAAATVGLYVTAAEVFESHVRATGTGFIVGVGRFGSAVSPAVAGGLFALGGGREGIAAVVGACAVIAGIMLAALPRQRAPGSPNRN